MTKRRSRTSMKREADALWSRLIRARGACEGRGEEGIPCSPNLQAAHVVPRRYLSVRWDEDNGLALCGAHHSFWTHFPIEFAMFLGRYIGAEKFEELQHRALLANGPPDYES